MLKFKEYLDFLQKKDFSEFFLYYVLEIALFESLYIRYGTDEFEEKIKDYIDTKVLKGFEQTDDEKEIFDIIVNALRTERNSYKNNICIVQLNTIFESYLYKFAQYWLENRIGILDECNVSLKELRQLEKEELIYQKIDDFIHDTLFRKGYEHIFSTINKKFKVNLNFDKNDLIALNDFYAIRNVIVHSSGRIDRRYKSKFPDSSYNIGDKVYISAT